MGRDIFSMILYGGRISLFIGLISTVLSTTIAVIYGSFSGIAPEWIDEPMMRFTEILLSIPSILLIIFLQALAGKNSVVAITIVIGLTSWMNIAKMVRTEVRQLRESEYLIAAKCMGGSFWHILRVQIHNRLHPEFHPASTAAEHNDSDNHADINNAAPLRLPLLHQNDSSANAVGNPVPHVFLRPPLPDAWQDTHYSTSEQSPAIPPPPPAEFVPPASPAAKHYPRMLL